MKIAESIVAAGLLGPERMRGLVAEFGDGAGLRATLDATGEVAERDIAQAIAQRLGIPYVDLLNETLSASVVGLVSPTLCRRYQLIPVRQTRRHLLVGMVDPSDLIALDDVATATGLSIAPVAVSIGDLEMAFGRYLRLDDELSELSVQMDESSTPSSSEGLSTELLDANADDAPVVRFVSLLISQAIDDRASDIHIEPGETHLTVRYRIDGVLHETQQASRSIQDGVISRLKIMASVDISERRKPQDGRISVVHGGTKVDLRLATLPTVWGEKIVMRILSSSASGLSLTDLRFSSRNERLFRDAITKPYGMVLVTGPTGSGKSTTLYTALTTIATPQVNAITVEDPVETRVPGINQVQVNHKAGLTFHTALRSILRSDPDIVLVGEIRDDETATMSIEAALTGHLVLSTLHTNDAPSALTRLINIGCEPFLVGTAMNAVVAQRLARRLCERCKEPYIEDPAKLAALQVPFESGTPVTFYRAKGCAECSGTGYRSRIALQEVMMMSDALEHSMTVHESSSALREIALREGMVSLRQDGFEKASLGATTIEEVLRVSV